MAQLVQRYTTLITVVRALTPVISKIYIEHLFVYLYWKDENKLKESGNGPLFFKKKLILLCKFRRTDWQHVLHALYLINVTRSKIIKKENFWLTIPSKIRSFEIRILTSFWPVENLDRRPPPLHHLNTFPSCRWLQSCNHSSRSSRSCEIYSCEFVHFLSQ